MDSVKLREILVEVAQGGAKELAEPEVFECAVNSGHEDIMSALKRVPGVVTDDAVERATIAIIDDDGELLSGLGFEVDDVRSWARAALTAALSSRTEEEREVPAYVRERADEEIAQIKASVAGSLTNGGE